MLLEKKCRFSILVFQDKTSKNQDFFMTVSAPMSNFRTFQVLKNEKSNFVTFHNFSRPVGTLHKVGNSGAWRDCNEVRRVRYSGRTARSLEATVQARAHGL